MADVRLEKGKMMRLKYLTQVCIASAIFATACTENGSKGLMPISTDSELALEFYETGMKAYDEFRFYIAVENLQKAVEEDPDFFMANFWLYFMPGLDYKEVGETLLKSNPPLNDAEQQIKSAFKYLVDGQSEKTVEHLEAAIAIYPEDPGLYKILYIYQYWYLKDFENAIKQMQRAIEVKADDGFTYNWLGYAYMDMENFKEAEEAFDRYIKLEPDLANPYDSKGDFYMDTQQYEKAYESYTHAYGIDSGFTISEKKAAKAKQMMAQSGDQKEDQ